MKLLAYLLFLANIFVGSHLTTLSILADVGQFEKVASVLVSMTNFGVAFLLFKVFTDKTTN